MLPFPTPWIRDAAHAFCVDPNNLILTWDGKQYTVGSTSRFYNGTLQNTELDPMTTIVTDPQWTQSYTDVNPHVRKCTYVLDYDPNTDSLVYRGFHSLVGQGHDAVE